METSARNHKNLAVALFIVRVALGIVFIAHGGQKVLGVWGGAGLAETMAGMEKMGIPPFLGAAAALTELLGGIGLVIGLLSRFWAAGLFIVMAVAAAKVHLAAGFFLQDKGFEYNFTLMAMALAVIVAGPGAYFLSDLEAKYAPWVKRS